MKTLTKLGIEGNWLNLIKGIWKVRANTMRNGERLNAFLLKSETRQECPFSTLLLNNIQEAPGSAIRQQK